MKKIFLGLFASLGAVFLTVLCIVFYGARFYTKPPKIPDALLLTLTLQGDMPEYAHGLSFLSALQGKHTSYYDLIHGLEQAEKDPRVKGLFLHVAQGGMGLAKTHGFLEALRAFRKSGKFVVAYADSFGENNNGTGQYFMALGADEIAMQPYGSINLVGIGVDVFHGKKALDFLKVRPRFYKREEFKTAINMLTEDHLTPAHKESLEGLLGSLYETLVKEIAHERDLTEQDVRGLIDQGPVTTARQAMKLGLTDHVYYQDQCVDYCLEKAGKGAEKMPFFLYSALKEHESHGEHRHPDTIAVLFGEGEIVRHGTQDRFLAFPEEGALVASHFAHHTQALLKEKDIRAVVVRVNTPGGSPVASETLWRQVKRLKEKGIPVVISMGDYCASGGYWMSTAADKIVASPMTMTGSIGVFGGKLVFSDFLDMMGVRTDHMALGKQALWGSAYKDFSEEEWRSYKKALDITYQAFLNKVSEGRKMDVSHVRAIAKGRPWTGEQALPIGLVDQLGDLKKAIAVAKELAGLSQDHLVNVQPYPREKTLPEIIKSLLAPFDEEEEEISDLHHMTSFLGRFIALFREKGLVQVYDDTALSF